MLIRTVMIAMLVAGPALAQTTPNTPPGTTPPGAPSSAPPEQIARDAPGTAVIGKTETQGGAVPGNTGGTDSGVRK